MNDQPNDGKRHGLRSPLLAAIAATFAVAGCFPAAPQQSPAYGSPTYGGQGAYGQPTAGGDYAEPGAHPGGRNVSFNGGPLSAAGFATLARLEAAAGNQLPNGNYWYDAVSGAAGPWGGPTAIFVGPGLALGGPLPANASGGGTGVFINNREIHPQEYRYLATLFNQRPQPGRYWLDHQGNAGREGGPALVNLIVLAQQRSGSSGGGRSWSYYTRGSGGSTGMGLAGDGQTTCVSTSSYSRCY